MSDATGAAGPAGPAYPPAPWALTGRGHLTTWRTAVEQLPALPDGVRPATARGRALVVTAFVDYSEAGLMAYHELLAAVVVRSGRGVALSITDIWVDSEVSMAGGRGLWGIPKDMSRFDGLSAADDAGPIAVATFRPLPVVGAAAAPLPTLGSRVLQTLGGRTVATPVRAAGRVRLARADWTFPAAGALGWLRGAKPVANVVADPFTLTFGTAG